MKQFLGILILWGVGVSQVAAASLPVDSVYCTSYAVEDIIQNIYSVSSAVENINYESLHEELQDIAANPIDINNATWNELAQLPFLSAHQIDNILLFIQHHPIESPYELRLIDGLKDYEIRDLCPFIKICPPRKKDTLYIKEVFHHAKHELTMRTDVRNAENFVSDPVFAQLRYKFNYHNRVQFGINIRRYPSAPASEMEYGGYVQLNDIWRFKSIVAGNYQVQFGQGLVISSPTHLSKSNYILNVGSEAEGLKRYTSVDSQALHGIGGTIGLGKVDVSTWYSLTRSNDSLRKHTIGANVTFKHHRLKVGLTALENLYSDTLRYYNENADYNQNYFRGSRQAVIGANMRWNIGRVDLFGEVATAQNQRWGVGVEVGTRIVPVADVGLILLYRYYSPTFDNTLGYAFSETSRINDENGLYLGTEIKKLKDWRFSLYGDVFRFAGIKYGIPYAPSWGYDASFLTDYLPTSVWKATFCLRAKEKAMRTTLSTYELFSWSDLGWLLRTRIDANLVTDSTQQLAYGASITQDVQYSFPTYPIVVQARLQAFDARNWNNRIYLYENDVLYANSVPATYGLGGRIYLNFRWQIICPLGIYLKVSETIYAKQWQDQQSLATNHRTDVHLLLHVTL